MSGTRSRTAAALVSWRWTALVLAAALGLLASLVRVGGDWDWLVAVGDHVRRSGAVPDAVPFAAADSSGWHDVPVLAQLVASWWHDAGATTAVLVHLVLVTVALVVAAGAARSRGASDAAVAWALVALVVGSLTSLGLVRAQTFSFVPFAVVLAILVRQHATPDRRIWWVVPVVAVWGNLHGAALLGTCVVGAYLLVDRLRLRPVETVCVGAATLLALCATPQGRLTPAYYLEVFDNVSAQRGEGLWARPSPTNPVDLVMLVAALALLVVVLRTRRPAWEYVAVAGLCLATADAARHGVWLLLLLTVLVAPDRSRTGRGPAPARQGQATGAVVAALAAVVVALPVAAVRGDAVLGASPDDVATLAAIAGDRVVLAPAPLSEALAVAGVRLWVSNPIDAFSHDDQAAYLDFLEGRDGGRRAIASSDLVVTREGTAPDDLAASTDGLGEVDCAPGWSCWVPEAAAG